MTSGANPNSLNSLIGYLLFSDGAPSPAFYKAVDDIFRAAGEVGPPALKRLRDGLSAQFSRWKSAGESPFGDAAFAESAIAFAFNDLLPAYRTYHFDLLHHLTDEELIQPFFAARLLETAVGVLRAANPQPGSSTVDEFGRVESITEPNLLAAILRLSDFVGYRPAAVLENNRAAQPYRHEFVAPIPVYLSEIGPAFGPFEGILYAALGHLRAADPDLLAEVWLDLNHMDEIAVDPRAYDYQHPINGRPGHQFGEWDPRRIDIKGGYRRYIIRKVIADILSYWLQHDAAGNKQERVSEAGAVLAGTFLLASGACGGGPDSLTSDMNIAALVGRIAKTRDRFYIHLVEHWPGKHGDRLRKEAARDKQPFGRLRQHLNLQLGKLRALHLQNDGLAKQYARMGFAAQAAKAAAAVQAPAARFRSLIETLLTKTDLALKEDRFDDAVEAPGQIVDLLFRAIGCGAAVDPWNILGFGGQFPWFAHTADSGPDSRVDHLLQTIERLFALWAKIWAAGAAAGRADVALRCRKECQAFSEWWDRYATGDVSDVKKVEGARLRRSGEFVALVLAEWRTSGQAAGDLSFWRKHSDGFDAEQTYALVLDALLHRNDLVASQALLVHWLGNEREDVRTAEGPFGGFIRRWLDAALALPPEARSRLVRRFFELLEANADVYWHAPGPELLFPGRPRGNKADDQDDEEPAEEEDADEFAAAYEGMIYRDSTGDGVEGEVMDVGGTNDDGLFAIHKELLARLQFLTLVARLLQQTSAEPRWPEDPDWISAVQSWANLAKENRKRLFQLLAALDQVAVPTPEISGEAAIADFDRKRSIKEELLEAVAAAYVDVSQSHHALASLLGARLDDQDSKDAAIWEEDLVKVHTALLTGNRRAVKTLLRKLFEQLRGVQVLYVPIRMGGDAKLFALTRLVRESLKKLSTELPWVGLFEETGELLRVARRMERNGPRDNRQVTEFEAVFTAGYRTVLEVVVRLLGKWNDTKRSDDKAASAVVETIDRFAEIWTEHVASVRISEIETRSTGTGWQSAKNFIAKYGRELFTPRFMQYANIRAILAQGVEQFLRSAEDWAFDESAPQRLLDDLRTEKYRRQDAASEIQFILRVVFNHYDLFRDYSATTTQSDYGDNLFALFELLKVSVEYDRRWWMMRTLYTAHRMLTAWGRPTAAAGLERVFASEMSREADALERQLKAVEREYGVTLAVVRDKIGERFIRPLEIDRTLALVEPAVADPTSAEFNKLINQLNYFVEQSTGAGFEPPQWLLLFEEEVSRVLGTGDDDFHHHRRVLPKLRYSQLLEQLYRWLKEP